MHLKLSGLYIWIYKNLFNNVWLTNITMLSYVITLLLHYNTVLYQAGFKSVCSMVLKNYNLTITVYE